jgi:hypothetical protein
MNYITILQTGVASIQIPGYAMDKTSAVYLSSDSVIPPSSQLTVINDFFTVNPLVSSLFPTATGYSYSNYKIVDANRLSLTISGLTGSGYIDALFYNAAGYTKLSDRGYQVALFSSAAINTEDSKFIVTEDSRPIVVE